MHLCIDKFNVQMCYLNHGSSDAGSEEDSDAVDEEDAGDGGDDDEPEPEEDVDLLVNDVEGQHAQAVMSLRGPTRPELVEAALGHLEIIMVIIITIIIIYLITLGNTTARGSGLSSASISV